MRHGVWKRTILIILVGGLLATTGIVGFGYLSRLQAQIDNNEQKIRELDEENRKLEAEDKKLSEDGIKEDNALMNAEKAADDAEKTGDELDEELRKLREMHEK